MIYSIKHTNSNEDIRDILGLSKVPRYLKIADKQSKFPSIWELRSRQYGKHYSGFSDVQDDDFDAQSLVLYSQDEQQQVISTGRIVFDSEQGLPADEYVKSQLDALRAKGLRLAEPSKFAISRAARGILPTYLLTFYEVAISLGLDALVFIIRDKNIGLYQNIVGAEVLQADIGYQYGTSHRFSLLMCRIEPELPYFFKTLEDQV